MSFTSIETRLSAVEARLTAVEARLNMVMWALGLNMALTLAVMGILLARH